MTISQSEILDMMQDFVDSARRIRELKDSLLYASFFGSGDDERLSLECQSYDETLSEIESIYENAMLPLVERVVAFLAAHADLVSQVSQPDDMCQAA